MDYGSAGGHRTMARAELELSRLEAELREPSDVAIEDWLLKRLGTKLKSLAPEGSGLPQKTAVENPRG
jgi:hypothetical protein